RARQLTPASWDRASAAGAFGVAQYLHLVMVAQYAVVLTLHHLEDVFRQSLLQSLEDTALGDIFSSLALVQNGLIVLAGDGRLEIYPAAMQVASHAGAVLGVATQTDDNGL